MIYYFGYGANADSKWIEQITGKLPVMISGGMVADHNLCIQTLREIPQPVQELLVSVWGDEYMVYTLIPGKGVVVGIIWKLDEMQFEAMRNWEIIKGWRKIDKVIVTQHDGTKQEAYTDMIEFNDQPTFACVDGISYPFTLNKNPGTKFDLEKHHSDISMKIEETREKLKEIAHQS